MRELQLELLNHRNALRQTILFKNFSMVLKSAKLQIKKQLISQFCSDKSNKFRFFYLDLKADLVKRIYSKEMLIIRLIFLNKGSLNDFDMATYGVVTKYFLEHFLLSFLFLHGIQLSKMDRKIRGYLQDFIKIEKDPNQLMDDRVDAHVITLIFLVLQRKVKHVDACLAAIRKQISENLDSLTQVENTTKIL